VIGAPAARAIRVLERLRPPETELLFAHHTLWGRANQLRGGQTRALTSGWTVTHLNAFIAWINDYCAEHGRTDGIPLVNGRPWKLTTPQFRRTMAMLTDQFPGSEIALGIQLKHIATKALANHSTQGYASADSSWAAHLESAIEAARFRRLEDLYQDHKTGEPIGYGPGAERMAHTFTEVQHTAHARGGDTTVERALLRKARISKVTRGR
jgi:hypothetical protein